MGINLRHEEREKAALSVGASEEWRGEVGLYGRPLLMCDPTGPRVAIKAPIGMKLRGGTDACEGVAGKQSAGL
jgi:hypothetical protein